MNILTASEAAARLRNGMTIAVSGFGGGVLSPAVAITSRFRAFAPRLDVTVLNSRSGRVA
jgi:acyl CoA:acetate/3-ketoacid CoA transferase alpha subunit